VEKQNRREQRAYIAATGRAGKGYINLAVEIDGEIKFKSDMEDVCFSSLGIKE